MSSSTTTPAEPPQEGGDPIDPEIVKEALATGRTVLEVARERSGLPADELERLFDVEAMTEPGSL